MHFTQRTSAKGGMEKTAHNSHSDTLLGNDQMNFRLNLFWLSLRFINSEVLELWDWMFGRDVPRKSKRRSDKRMGNETNNAVDLHGIDRVNFLFNYNWLNMNNSLNIHNFQCDAHTKRSGTVFWVWNAKSDVSVVWVWVGFRLLCIDDNLEFQLNFS